MNMSFKDYDKNNSSLMIKIKYIMNQLTFRYCLLRLKRDQT